MREFFTAMDNAMADGFDLVERFDSPCEQEFEDFIQAGFVRGEDLIGNFYAFAIGSFMLENANGLANALDVAFCNDFASRHFEELILDR